MSVVCCNECSLSSFFCLDADGSFSCSRSLRWGYQGSVFLHKVWGCHHPIFSIASPCIALQVGGRAPSQGPTGGVFNSRWHVALFESLPVFCRRHELGLKVCDKSTLVLSHLRQLYSHCCSQSLFAVCVSRLTRYR